MRVIYMIMCYYSSDWRLAMFGFSNTNKRKEKVDINEAYEDYIKHPDTVAFLNVDEVKHYDERHVIGALNLPDRLMKDIEEYYPDKSIKYYVYSVANGHDYHSVGIMLKKGYNAYQTTTYGDFRGEEEGRSVKKKRRKRRR